MTCDHARRLMTTAMDGPPDATLSAHLASCEPCRQALDEQRHVAEVLRARPPASASPVFAARIRARLDAEEGRGMLDLANWRLLGGALAPVAAALTLAAWLGIGIEPADTAAVEPGTGWSQLLDADSEAAVFLQPDASSDRLLESVLSGIVPAETGEPDVR